MSPLICRLVGSEAREQEEKYRRECYEELSDHFAGAARRKQEQRLNPQPSLFD